MCPHVILKDKTPKEVFSGIKPEVGHLRIFGCPMYIHVPKEKRTKMEHLGKKGFLWGTVITPRIIGFIYQVRGK
jgi:hypothetical protein